jgi:hypothetical protein
VKNNNILPSLALAAALTAIGLACSKPVRTMLHPLPASFALTGEALKVTLDNEGAITVNGTTMPLEGLNQVLDKLSPGSDLVWYYRDASNGTPPPNAIEILQNVVNRKLAIRFSTEPDFSDFKLSN